MTMPTSEPMCTGFNFTCQDGGYWTCTECGTAFFGILPMVPHHRRASSGEPSDEVLISVFAQTCTDDGVTMREHIETRALLSNRLAALRAELQEARCTSEQAVAEANCRDAKWMEGVLDACKPTAIAFDGLPNDALEPPKPTLHDFVAGLRDEVEALTKERKTALSLLTEINEYAWHDGICNENFLSGMTEGDACECGLSELSARIYAALSTPTSGAQTP